MSLSFLFVFINWYNAHLPESTYSLLMTEKIMSIPFFTGILSVFLSLFALVLALKNELDNGESGNFLGKQIVLYFCICSYINLTLTSSLLHHMEIIFSFPGLPAGVQSEVRMAQYLGILIGVLMEDGKYY